MSSSIKKRAHRLVGELELQSLFELSRTLSATRDLQRVFDILLLTPMGRMKIPRAAIYLRKDGAKFTLAAQKGIASELRVDRVELSAAPLKMVQKADAAPQLSALLAQMQMQYYCPIVFDQKCLGFLLLAPRIDGRDLKRGELAYLEAMGNLAAPVLENNRYLLELQDVNRKLDRRIQELQTLFEIGGELNSTLDKSAIADTLSFAVMGEMMVQHCVVLFSETNGNLEVLARKGQVDREQLLLQDPVLASRLLKLNRPTPAEELPDEELRQTFRACRLELHIPMVLQDEVKGALLLGRRLHGAGYDENELQFLSTLANAAATALENARLFEEALEKQRLEEELAIAHDIQKRLLPQQPPQLEGLDLFGLNWPSKQVGGDYYDFFEIDNDRLVLTIGDVSGKGVPAALLMANLQASLHALIHAGWPLHKTVARINDLVFRNTAVDKFITFFIAVLDLRTRTLTCVNAGHNPPILLRGEQAHKLQVGGLLLGMMGNVAYEEETWQLQPDDWLVLYTDGVSEAMNPEDEEFTEHRVEAVMRQHRGASAQEMLEALATAVQDFSQGAPQADDITLVALHVKS